MKKNKILLGLLFFIMTVSCDDSINNKPKEEINDNLLYYPLQVGDFWIYNITHSGNSVDGIYDYLVKRVILKDSIFEGKRYFLVKDSALIFDSTILKYSTPYKKNELQRVDTVDSRIKLLWNINHGEYNFIDLSMKEGDSESRGSGTGWLEILLQKEDTLNVLGLFTDVKRYKKKDAYQLYYYDYAKDIGLIKFRQFGEYDDYNMILMGAKIGDNIFGDTSMIK